MNLMKLSAVQGRVQSSVATTRYSPRVTVTMSSRIQEFLVISFAQPHGYQAHIFLPFLE